MKIRIFITLFILSIVIGCSSESEVLQDNPLPAPTNLTLTSLECGNRLVFTYDYDQSRLHEYPPVWFKLQYHHAVFNSWQDIQINADSFVTEVEFNSDNEFWRILEIPHQIPFRIVSRTAERQSFGEDTVQTWVRYNPNSLQITVLDGSFPNREIWNCARAVGDFGIANCEQTNGNISVCANNLPTTFVIECDGYEPSSEITIDVLPADITVILFPS